MYKCPACGEEIDHLCHTNLEMVWYHLYYAKGSVEGDYHQKGQECVGENTFSCPECLETLALTEEDALAILKGEKEPTVIPSPPSALDVLPKAKDALKLFLQARILEHSSSDAAEELFQDATKRAESILA